MITKKKGEYPSEFWGQAKGYVRHIRVDGNHAVYVVEESPGFRTIRYNRRRYTVFCPWMYFFVKVYAHLEPDDSSCLYAFFSRKQIESFDEEALLLTPFPNGSSCGGICMPHLKKLKAERPIEAALELIWHFWASSGNDVNGSILEMMPDALKDKVPGRIFGKWSRLSPERVMGLRFPDPDHKHRSISSAAVGLTFKY